MFQNTCWKNPNITVNRGFWHCLKHLTWAYFNSIYNTLQIMNLNIDPYIITYKHWTNTSRQYFFSTFKCSVHQNGPFNSNHCLDGAIFYPIVMWRTRPTKYCLLLLLKKNLHKIWFSVVCLYYHSLALSLLLKGGGFLDSFSRIYLHLMFGAHKTTGMFKKDTSIVKISYEYEFNLVW